MYKYYSAMQPIVPGGYPKTEPVRKVINFDARATAFTFRKLPYAVRWDLKRPYSAFS